MLQSSKEANTSHAVAANLSELELKKILIDKMEANNSFNRYIWLIRSQLKDLEQTGGPKEEGQEKNPLLPVLQVKRQPRQQERLPIHDLRLTRNLLANLLR
ncbi:hypothetical protein Tco_0391270 [Tanacetum coccineum]